MKSEGQAWALDQLAEIAQASSGSLEVIDAVEPTEDGEAVLATLAIVVWHFYSVIFDPDVYPLDPAAFTGYSPRSSHSEPENSTMVEEKSEITHD